MKLTKQHKETIVWAVMNDTPEEYSGAQAADDATAIFAAMLPKEVRRIWDDVKTRHWVATRYVSGLERQFPKESETPVPEKVLAIVTKREAARRGRNGLRQHVANVVSQFTTDTQMRELIPELDKYIPKANALNTQNLPVVTTLVADLHKAGWPAAKTEVQNEPT